MRCEKEKNTTDAILFVTIRKKKMKKKKKNERTCSLVEVDGMYVPVVLSDTLDDGGKIVCDAMFVYDVCGLKVFSCCVRRTQTRTKQRTFGTLIE